MIPSIQQISSILPVELSTKESTALDKETILRWALETSEEVSETHLKALYSFYPDLSRYKELHCKEQGWKPNQKLSIFEVAVEMNNFELAKEILQICHETKHASAIWSIDLLDNLFRFRKAPKDLKDL